MSTRTRSKRTLVPSHLRHTLLAALTISATTGCSDPFGIGGSSSTFEATVSGAVNTTIRGAISTSDDFLRQTSGTVTAPGGDVLRYVSLQASDGSQGLTFSTRETPTVGEHVIVPPGSRYIAGTFSGSYMQRHPNELRFSVADSGSITFTSVGGSLRGHFVLYASKYDALPLLDRGSAGRIDPIGHGTNVVRIAGTFDAGERRR